MGGVTEIECTAMAILGRECTGQDLTNEVDDSVRTGAEFTNDLELAGEVKVDAIVGDGGRTEMDVMILQEDTLADEITRSENVFDGGGTRGGVTGRGGTRMAEGRRREGEGCGGREGARKSEWTGGDGRQECGKGKGRRKGRRKGRGSGEVSERGEGRMVQGRMLLLGWTGRTVFREALVEETRSGMGIIRTMFE